MMKMISSKRSHVHQVGASNLLTTITFCA